MHVLCRKIRPIEINDWRAICLFNAFSNIVWKHAIYE